MTVLRVTLLTAVLLVGAVLAVVFGGTEVTGRASAKEYDGDISPAATAAMCRGAGEPATVVAYFTLDDPDTAMRLKAEEMAGDERFEEIGQETQAQAYERFKEIFADQPELVEKARPEGMPASLFFTPADGLTATALLADLRDELTGPAVDSLDIACRGL